MSLGRLFVQARGRLKWSFPAIAGVACAALSFTGFAAAAPGSSSSPIPAFDAVSLTGQTIRRADLLGQPTVLIVTPGRDAAPSTRAWAKALRSEFGKDARMRDLIVVDLPFFMEERDAIGRAKAKIPERYHDQTWLSSKETLSTALGVAADAAGAQVFVLDAQGRIAAEVRGDPSPERIDQLRAALRALR
jgi:peroxiredoxin